MNNIDDVHLDGETFEIEELDLVLETGDVIIDIPHGSEHTITEITDDSLYLDGDGWTSKKFARSFLTGMFWEHKS